MIECTLVENTSQDLLSASPSSGLQFQLFPEGTVLETLGQAASSVMYLDSEQQIFEFASNTNLTISIGPCSNMHGILLRDSEFGSSRIMNIDDYRFLTLQIGGAKAATQNAVTELLQRVGNSLLFQLDLSCELTLMLKRTRNLRKYRRSSSGSRRAVEPLAPVGYEYDCETMSLYWYGKTASAMPLLQFLAYYQVIEFYFPVYSRREAQETLRNILKDPTFSPIREADIAKLFDAIKFSSKGRTVGNELEQLQASIQHCVTADDLRRFLISEDDDRYKFYTSDSAKKLVKPTIPVRQDSNDHREAVAKRIYSIRNRIVHTKSGYEDEQPLFPFDPETKYLQQDIDLVEFLARKVLIASSRPLQV